MDAASRTGLLLFVFLGSLVFGDSGIAQEPTAPSPVSTPNPLQVFAQWVGQWMAKSPSISVRFAIHEVTVNEASTLAPCGHKMCGGGKCYEVEVGRIEGIPCDAPRTEDTMKPAEDEPIIEVPVAPPLPPNYQFTWRSSTSRVDPLYDVAMDSLSTSQVSIPATLLVALLVDHARHETQLAMTHDLLEERSAFLKQLRELSDRNTQLQSQLAISQIYLDYYATASTIETPIATSDMRAIQKDLDSEGTGKNAWSHPWRSSRRSHDASIAPDSDNEAQTARDPKKNIK